jgi:FAD/FMN-containing dehydrogenase
MKTLTDIPAVGQEDLAGLRDRTRGAVLVPGAPGFAEATRVWNGLVDKTPAVVVRASGAADTVEAVRFASAHDLPVSVRCGGHNVGGTALAEGGVTIDMSALRGVHVDPEARTATVQPGCLLGDVDRETQLHGLATPLGFMSEVGVAGLTLGGGLGYLTRRFGWTVDNLLEADVVTADGELRRASREQEPDLFWAIRGAGHNFGVVTSFTFRLHPVGPMVYGGLIAWPFERAAEIQAAYREITTNAPRELAAWMILIRAPDAPFVPAEWQGELICAFAVCCSADADARDEVMAPIRDLGEPVLDLLEERPYAQVQSYLDDTEPKGDHYYWKTGFVAEQTDEFQATLRELAVECPVPHAQIGTLHVAGALNEQAGDDGAVGNRHARWVCGLIGAWEPDEARDAEYQAWIRDSWRRLEPFTSGNYINFQTADEGEERIRASYGENYERLVELKRRYDPENVFRSNRNLAPGSE